MRITAWALVFFIATLFACSNGDRQSNIPDNAQSTLAEKQRLTSIPPNISKEPDRKIILVGGASSTTEETISMFTPIIEDLEEIGFSFKGIRAPDDDFIVFSYKPDAYVSPFHPEDENLDYEAADSLAIHLPSSNFYSILDAYPDSTFDIIGHSIGGVVALYWAGTAERYRPWYPDRVHSIVTLDSPVGGMPDLRYLLPLSDVEFDVQGLAHEIRPQSYVVAGAARAPSTIDVVTLGNTNQVVIPENLLTLGNSWAPLDKPLKWDAGGPTTASDLLPFKQRISHYHELITSNANTLEWIRAAVLMDGPRWSENSAPNAATSKPFSPPPPPNEDKSSREVHNTIEQITNDPISVSGQRMLVVKHDDYRILYESDLNWLVIEILTPPWIGSPFTQARADAEQALLKLLGDHRGNVCALSVSVVEGTGIVSPLNLCKYGSSGGGTLVGESTHSYALAYSPARRMFEEEDGTLRVFFYDGLNVVVSTKEEGGEFGTPLKVNHVPVAATGFSVTRGDDFFLVTYSAVRATVLFVRRLELEEDILTLGNPVLVMRSSVDSSFQAPFVNLDPDGVPWIVFRADRGTMFPVFAVAARGPDGLNWNDPIDVSTKEQLNDSASGTSGAIYWVDGSMVIVQGGSTALHASIGVNNQWVSHVIDDRYTGVHGFSGIVTAEQLPSGEWVQETLHLAYIVDGELHLIRYQPYMHPKWSSAIQVGTATTHSVSLSNVNGVPTVFGYDGHGTLWYRTMEMDNVGTLANLPPEKIQYAWTSSPAQASKPTAAWIDGLVGQGETHKIYSKQLELDAD